MKTQHGFTLIEVLVYLALFAILLGGAVAVAFNVIESSGHNQTKTILQEEGDFLLAKIHWALSGVAVNGGIISPPLPSDCTNPTQSSVLTVNKSDGASVAINLNGSDMELQKGPDTNKLNNSSTQVKSLVFAHFCQSGDGINPEKIDAGFMLAANTPNGLSMSQDFSTTIYIRK